MAFSAGIIWRQEQLKPSQKSAFRISKSLQVFALLCLIVSLVSGQPASKSKTTAKKTVPAQKDEELGAAVVPENLDYLTNQGGNMPPPSSATAALTEKEKRRQENLAQSHPGDKLSVHIDSIYPAGGPTTGDTRVLVRGGPFEDMHLVHPRPKCKFGRHDMIVDATYVTCSKKPLTVDLYEGKHADRDSHCLQCDASPPSAKAELVSLLVSLTGDFSDTADSEVFRYYLPPEVHAIYPRYGIKDGETTVQLWGKNFLNFDIHTRCGFGSKSVVAHYYNSTYMTCNAPSSDVVEKPIPFSVSLNQQQNTKQEIYYWYYNTPIVSKLEPNYGLNAGGNEILLHGSNFYPFDYQNSTFYINNKNDSFCYFEQLDVKMPFEAISSTRAKCIAPPNLPLIDSTFVEVALNNRDWSDDNVPYFYYKPAKIINIEPREGPTRGGTIVMIYGNEFTPGKKVICNFGTQQTYAKIVGMGQIKCQSPQTVKPGIVSLSISYVGEDQKFQSESKDYLYYETPTVASIGPECGPFSGFTQLLVRGDHFDDMGFGKVKCIFNQTVAMNATIINQTALYCDSPQLREADQVFDPQYSYYTVQVTLNGAEMSEGLIKFMYYPDLKISSIQSNVGPVSGGTTSYLSGVGFTHPNVCKPAVKYGPLEQKPELVQDQFWKVISPQVAVPGSVTLFASGNQQNYGSDYTLHYRDIENTFTYIQDVYLEDFQPETGPSVGGTKVIARGYGFQTIRNANGTLNTQLAPMVRFIDQNKKQIGVTQDVTDLSNTHFTIYSPAAPAGTKAIIQLSYNKGLNWQSLPDPGKDYSFSYYAASTISGIEPSYGPVKVGKKVDITGKSFECPDSACSKLKVKFHLGDDEGIIVPATLQSSSKIQVETPAYTKPDVLPISISFNGVDYTPSNITYGYFYPYVIKVEPKLLTYDKPNQLTIKGFGYIDPVNKDDLKVKFTSPEGEMSCGGVSPCVVQAKFVNKNTITCMSKLMSELTYSNGTKVTFGQPVYAEVGLAGHFTQQQVAVYYFNVPTYKKVQPTSVPQNLIQHLKFETEFYWNLNSIDLMFQYTNITCMFTIKDEVKYTQGRMETMPFGSLYDTDTSNDKPTHIICPTPKTDNTGKAIIKIAMNGQDFTGSIDFEFSPNLQLYKILPQSGPFDKAIATSVRLYGAGFDAQKDKVFSKFGVLATQEITQSEVKKQAWNFISYLNAQQMNIGDLGTFESRDIWVKDNTMLDTIVVKAPHVQDGHKLGGQVYVSIGQIDEISYLNHDGKITTEDRHHFSNDLVDYVYYKNPVVVKVEPTSGFAEGGTPIEVTGAWFNLQPSHGIIPMCRFGEKIVRARYDSTVRIVCNTPPSDNILTPVPVHVSLNGVDWVDSGSKYSYYVQAEIKGIEPKIGAVNSGTLIFVKGKNFSNITDSEMSKCQWTLIENVMGETRPQFLTQYTPATYHNGTHMVCLTPGHFIGGDRAYVQLTFNNLDYSEQSEDLIFQFYQINGIFPHSGPSNTKNEVILVRGKGISPNSKVICSLNRTEQLAVEIKNDVIKCPMSWPGKDPEALGTVKFGIRIDDGWSDLGNFYFYEQISVSDLTPRYGPSEGNGLIYVSGIKFVNDFPNSELGCKIGESIGKGVLIDQTLVMCTVHEMELVNEGETLPVYVALNSYSWVGEKQNQRMLGSTNKAAKPKLGYTPYGVQSIFPESGIVEGFTDVYVTGKGFTSELAPKARCRFGVDGKYHIVDAQVLDYTKLVCRSPPSDTKDYQSVPFSIALGDAEFKPWTLDLHRFRYYKQPLLDHAQPAEVDVRRKAEIYVYPRKGYTFNQPVPTGIKGTKDYHVTGRVSCSFGQFGTSLGMYVNQTTMLCLSPHIPGRANQYSRHLTKVAVAWNGEDFLEDTSQATVTFVGTGSNYQWLYVLFTTLLIALFVIALIILFIAVQAAMPNNADSAPEVITLRNSVNHEASNFTSTQNNPNRPRLLRNDNSMSRGGNYPEDRSRGGSVFPEDARSQQSFNRYPQN